MSGSVLDMAQRCIAMYITDFDSVVVIESVGPPIGSANGDQLLGCTYPVSSVHRGLERGWLAVPSPRQSKAGHSFRQDGLVQMRILPISPAVAGYFDPRDP
jgi:hypothetical protein